MHVTTTSESPVSFSFTIQPNIFKLQAILRQVRRMTLNDLAHSKVKGPNNHVTTTPRIPNLIPLRSTARRFRVAGHFVTSVPNYPQKDLGTKRSKVPPYTHIHATTTASPEFKSVSLYDPPFLSYRPF